MPPDTRFDSIRLDARRAVRTDEGFLRVPARITRTGILEYHRGGKIVRELRRPDEVFAPESMASLAGVPVTVGHSSRYVTSKDVAQHAVGFVGPDVQQADGRYLEATLTIWRNDAVDAVEGGHLTEISAGYRPLKFGPGGEYGGAKYDLEQQQIRYNHAAMLPAGRGRGGSELAIRLDDHDLITLLRTRLDALGASDADLATALGMPDAGAARALLDGLLGTPDVAVLTRAADMIQIPLDDLLSMAPAPEPLPSKAPRMKRSITLNGVAFPIEIADELAPQFDAAQTAGEQARTDADDAAATLVAVERERDALKARCDAFEAQAAAAAVDAAKAQAKPHFAAVAGDSVRDIHVATLQHLGHGDDVRADASDDEIAGLFRMALKAAVKAPSTPAAPAPAPTADTRNDRAETGADAARERMLERNRNAWKGKD